MNKFTSPHNRITHYLSKRFGSTAVALCGKKNKTMFLDNKSFVTCAPCEMIHSRLKELRATRRFRAGQLVRPIGNDHNDVPLTVIFCHGTRVLVTNGFDSALFAESELTEVITDAEEKAFMNYDG